MRINDSKDGKRRLDLKINLRMTSNDMAVHLLNRLRCAPHINGNDTGRTDEELSEVIKDTLDGLSHLKILDCVRRSVLGYGEKQAYHCLIDNRFSRQVDFVREYLEERFNGFSAKKDGAK